MHPPTKDENAPSRHAPLFQRMMEYGFITEFGFLKDGSWFCEPAIPQPSGEAKELFLGELADDFERDWAKAQLILLERRVKKLN